MPHEYPELVCAGGYLRHVTELINVGFRAERAVSPRDGGVWWVVLDAELVVHREASAFLACLQGADRSPHTIRAYAGRAALFLGWCAGQGGGLARSRAGAAGPVHEHGRHRETVT